MNIEKTENEIDKKLMIEMCENGMKLENSACAIFYTLPILAWAGWYWWFNIRQLSCGIPIAITIFVAWFGFAEILAIAIDKVFPAKPPKYLQ